MALEYVDAVYNLSRSLPESERFNLRSQVERAATSIVLNIAEGSTGQSNAEQNRFLGLALRSYLETIACFDIIEQQGYLGNNVSTEARRLGHQLFVKLQAFRRSLVGLPKTTDRGQDPRSSVTDPPSRNSNPPSSVSGRGTQS